MFQELQDLVGKQVVVWTHGTEIELKGTLESVDRRWLRLRERDGSILCFFVYNVIFVRALPG